MKIKKVKKSSSRRYKEVIRVLIVGTLLILIFYRAIFDAEETMRKESKQVTQKAIKRAMLQCYVIEGQYPPCLEYLKENYGLIINTKEYSVHYEVFAVNIMPDITVIEKSEGR